MHLVFFKMRRTIIGEPRISALLEPQIKCFIMIDKGKALPKKTNESAYLQGLYT